MKKYEVQRSLDKSIINTKQIRALLWKDLLVRIRQPWLTLLHYVWPFFLFTTLYCFGFKYASEIVEDCQFPTRQLPIKYKTLSFFQSYICTVDNECWNATEYEETSKFENAPLTPILNLVQTFINEPLLLEAVVNLPQDKNIIGALTRIYTHKKFGDLQHYANAIKDKMPMFAELTESKLDFKSLMSDDSTFISAGNILCGRPFEISTEQPAWVQIIFSKSNKIKQDETDSMPTPYCKQLYQRVANSTAGKLTWSLIKPVIQGKIVYGPGNPLTDEIMTRATRIFEDVMKLQQFVGALNQLVILLRTDNDFQSEIQSWLDTLKLPYIRRLISHYIDIDSIEHLIEFLMLDDKVAATGQTIVNMLECVSTDRLVRVTTEAELEKRAYELNEKKMLYSSVYFNNVSRVTDREYSYKIRMDIDNIPVTSKTRNRFCFPGPNANLHSSITYHRGFIQLQHSVDQAIIETIRHHESLRLNELQLAELIDLANYKNSMDTSVQPDTLVEPDDSDESDTSVEPDTLVEPDISVEPDTSVAPDTLVAPDDYNKATVVVEETTTLPTLVSESETESNNNVTTVSEEVGSHVNENDGSIHDGERKIRRRRNDLSWEPEQQTFHVNQLDMFTKQFPYPKYKKDVYVIGIYKIQAIQLAFLLGLAAQISVSVWQRIWTKESGNSTLMRVMGLRKSSENLAWIITNIIELLLVFTPCLIGMYIAGILIVTNLAFMYFFLTIFIICLISFSYMMSTFFSNATIGAALNLTLIYFMFLPYIVMVAHETELTFASRFFANLCMPTAFSSAWRHIMLYELLQKHLSFDNAFSGSISDNDLKFGLFMLMFDTVLYSIIGYLSERFTHSDFKSYKVPVKDMDVSIGGCMSNVTKTFDGKKLAVDNVSIVFRRDHVTCLLGQNGAGKSTIIKLLLGQVKQTSGEIYLSKNLDRVCGMETKGTVGLCQQNNVMIPNLTAKEHLELYASIKAPDRYKDVLKDTIESLDFGKHLHFKCENLSGGFKRRLNIAMAFIGSPNLVILDEPCSGVDDKARRKIWQLIGDLRKGRTVVLATHYLDEAERLGDNVLFVKDGKIISENMSETLRNQFTKSFDIQIKLGTTAERRKTIEKIQNNLETHAPSFNVTHQSDDDYHINIPYCDVNNGHINFEPLIKSIEKQHQLGTVSHFRVISKNLAEMFNNQTARSESEILSSDDGDHRAMTNGDGSDKLEPPATNNQFKCAKHLLWKRFIHFKRNYGLIILIFLVPTIFQMIALTCMTYRPPGEFDTELVFSQELYANTTEFYAYENTNKFDNKTIAYLKCHDQCEYFNSSKEAFYSILETHDHSINRRYGGITLNDSKLVVWYNNKGYHALPVYLNEMNSALFKAEMNNDLYKITTSSHPLKLGRKDLSLSSILEQMADAALAIVLVIAFSFVVTTSSVYVVTERVSGEKLQQRLCNVAYRTYWGVAFLWDFSLFFIALLITMGIFKMFDIPIYTSRDNLHGICLLIFMYGLAMIPMVHLVEKLFYDAGMANMYMVCLNIVIAFSPVITITLFDVLGDSEESRMVRHFLNRLFLVFPQHAFTDGLLEICKNHVTTGIFARIDMCVYRSPIASTLLLPHILSSLIVGLVFLVLNYLIENGHIQRLCRKKPNEKSIFLNAVTNDQVTTEDKYDVRTRGNILVVENLCKNYGRHQALGNISFNIADSECFGLLGENGAGKSTIFSILSGEIYQSSGSVQLIDKKGISYCPQTNALDGLLTVEEVIYFYGRLRKTSNIEHLITSTLKSFHLEPYRNILVKNLSGGNRRKLSVAIACFGDTRLVLMDEPTSEIDPVTRALVCKAINSLIAAKRSVILTSHTISEIEQVCHRIGVIHGGKIISIDTPMALKERFGRSYVVKLYYDQIESMTIEQYVQKNLEGVEHLTMQNNCLEFCVKVRTDQYDNSIGPTYETRILLSDLFGKLYNFTLERKIAYTVSECLLDQVIQQVLETESKHCYNNPAFSIDETRFL
ncbi:ATP-binding cassette sub-family A member 12-like [Bradysia coprophila]|uniref:ATP-binding cassette sub-family A member 12-like n=1 Tax=Bradysia coprophila TaxID=38358 RepID=UPI00187DD5D8|nr:ATP-binding cassette sub-family A member 12-like [Bradysia coprophila]